MKQFAWLVGYLVGVFAGAALLAPWVWWAVHWLALNAGIDWAQALLRHPFHRYVHRCLLGLALVGLLPLARALGCRTLREVGLASDGRGLRLWVTGAALGLLMFVVGWSFQMWTGFRVTREHVVWSAAGRVVIAAAATGLIVGCLEEILFRGVLYGGVKRNIKGPWAILISSLVYSAVHFLQRAPTPEPIHWLSGAMTVTRMLAGLVSFDRMIPAFFTLFMAGVLLAWSYQRTGSLFFSMGLHSGWVFWIKVANWMTVRRIPGANPGNGVLVPDASSFWVVALVLGLMWVWVRKHKQKVESP